MRVMYDSVTLGEIPHNAQAVAGYVGGRFPTFSQLKRIWPKANRLSIAIDVEEVADCLDCEPGDENPADLEGIHHWVMSMMSRGISRPCVYASQSNMGAIVRHLESKGLKRGSFRVWSAHYAGFPHICSPHTCRLPDGQPCDFTADGTQHTDKALNRNLDESLLHDDFFARPAPKPKRKPVPKVSAAGLSGLITAGILAALHKGGVVHPSTAETGVIDAVAAFLAGYIKRG